MEVDVIMSVEGIAGVTQTYQEMPRRVQNIEAVVPEHANVVSASSQPVVIQPVFPEGSAAGQGEKNKNQQANEKQMQMAVSNANNKMRHSKTKAEFSYHEPTNSVSIRIMDEETNEVIKEIPPEETLDMIVKMWELAGIMVDEKR